MGIIQLLTIQKRTVEIQIIDLSDNNKSVILTDKRSQNRIDKKSVKMKSEKENRKDNNCCSLDQKKQDSSGKEELKIKKAAEFKQSKINCQLELLKKSKEQHVVHLTITISMTIIPITTNCNDRVVVNQMMSMSDSCNCIWIQISTRSVIN